MPLLVIFLLGTAATAVAFAAAPAGLAPAAGVGLFFSCAFGSWINVTDWLATSNIVGVPWKLVKSVLILLDTSSDAIITIPFNYVCFTWYIELIKNILGWN